MTAKTLTELDWHHKEKATEPCLSRIHEHAEKIRQQELEKALTRLQAIDCDLTETDEAVIETLTQRLVNELLETPTQAMYEAAQAEDYVTIREAMDIFQLNDANEEASMYMERRTDGGNRTKVTTRSD